MPQIPRAKRQVGEPDRTMNVQYGAEQAEARGLSDLGKGIQNFASAVGTMQKSRQELNDNFKVTEAVNRRFAKRAVYMAELSAKKGTNSQNVTSEFNVSDTTADKEVIEELGLTPEQTASYREKWAPQYWDDVTKITFQQQRETYHAAAEAFQTVANSMADVAHDAPETRAAQISRLPALIDSFVTNRAVALGFDEDKINELLVRSIEGINRASILGAINKDPEAAHKEIKEGYITIGGEKLILDKLFQYREETLPNGTVVKVNDVEDIKKRAKLAAKEKIEDDKYYQIKYDNDYSQSFVSDLAAGKPSLDAMKRDTELSPQMKDALEKAFYADRYFEDDPDYFVNLSKRLVLNPENINIREDIINHIGAKKGERLSAATAAKMIGELSGMLNPDGTKKAGAGVFKGQYEKQYGELIQTINQWQSEEHITDKTAADLVNSLTEYYRRDKNKNPIEWGKDVLFKEGLAWYERAINWALQDPNFMQPGTKPEEGELLKTLSALDKRLAENTQGADPAITALAKKKGMTYQEAEAYSKQLKERASAQ